MTRVRSLKEKAADTVIDTFKFRADLSSEALLQITEPTTYLWVKQKKIRNDSAYHIALLLLDFHRFGADRESH